ncbi:META domain-containing protein [Coraliomargarita parva]|uniref:META domain-containing protein n=1 Tax=Coraliomargarita parva TaxID=3014050 RepID=UPI0022B56ABE|nr:META domain-containing protein [Coraliomargarita parva]
MKYIHTLLALIALSVLAACTSTSQSSESIPLEGTAWTLAAYPGMESLIDNAPKAPTLQFDPKTDIASGFSGVNRFSGHYALDGSQLALKQMISTKMAGHPAAMKLESAFLKTLATVDSWMIKDGQLYLRSEGNTILVLEPSGA